MLSSFSSSSFFLSPSGEGGGAVKLRPLQSTWAARVVANATSAVHSPAGVTAHLTGSPSAAAQAAQSPVFELGSTLVGYFRPTFQKGGPSSNDDDVPMQLSFFASLRVPPGVGHDGSFGAGGSTGGRPPRPQQAAALAPLSASPAPGAGRPAVAAKDGGTPRPTRVPSPSPLLLGFTSHPSFVRRIENELSPIRGGAAGGRKPQQSQQQPHQQQQPSDSRLANSALSLTSHSFTSDAYSDKTTAKGSMGLQTTGQQVRFQHDSPPFVIPDLRAMDPFRATELEALTTFVSMRAHPAEIILREERMLLVAVRGAEEAAADPIEPPRVVLAAGPDAGVGPGSSPPGKGGKNAAASAAAAAAKASSVSPSEAAPSAPLPLLSPLPSELTATQLLLLPSGARAPVLMGCAEVERYIEAAVEPRIAYYRALLDSGKTVSTDAASERRQTRKSVAPAGGLLAEEPPVVPLTPQGEAAQEKLNALTQHKEALEETLASAFGHLNRVRLQVEQEAYAVAPPSFGASPFRAGGGGDATPLPRTQPAAPSPLVGVPLASSHRGAAPLAAVASPPPSAQPSNLRLVAGLLSQQEVKDASLTLWLGKSHGLCLAARDLAVDLDGLPCAPQGSGSGGQDPPSSPGGSLVDAASGALVRRIDAAAVRARLCRYGRISPSGDIVAIAVAGTLNPAHIALLVVRYILQHSDGAGTGSGAHGAHHHRRPPAGAHGSMERLLARDCKTPLVFAWQKHPVHGAVSVFLAVVGFEELLFLKTHSGMPTLELGRCIHHNMIPTADAERFDLRFLPESLGVKVVCPRSHPVRCSAGEEAVVLLEAPPGVVLIVDEEDPVAAAAANKTSSKRHQLLDAVPQLPSTKKKQQHAADSDAKRHAAAVAPTSNALHTFIDRDGRFVRLTARCRPNRQISLAVYAKCSPSQPEFLRSATILVHCDAHDNRWSAPAPLAAAGSSDDPEGWLEFPTATDYFQLVGGSLVSPRQGRIGANEAVEFVVQCSAHVLSCSLAGSHGTASVAMARIASSSVSASAAAPSPLREVVPPAGKIVLRPLHGGAPPPPAAAATRSSPSPGGQQQQSLALPAGRVAFVAQVARPREGVITLWMDGFHALQWTVVPPREVVQQPTK